LYGLFPGIQFTCARVTTQVSQLTVPEKGDGQKAVQLRKEVL
jgi:hypothetical protein